MLALAFLGCSIEGLIDSLPAEDIERYLEKSANALGRIDLLGLMEYVIEHPTNQDVLVAGGPLVRGLLSVPGATVPIVSGAGLAASKTKEWDAVRRAAKQLKSTTPKTIKWPKLKKETFNELNRIRKLEGQPALTERNAHIFANVFKNLKIKRLETDKETAKQAAQTIYNALYKGGTVRKGKYSTSQAVVRPRDKVVDTAFVGRAADGRTSIKSGFRKDIKRE